MGIPPVREPGSIAREDITDGLENAPRELIGLSGVAGEFRRLSLHRSQISKDL